MLINISNHPYCNWDEKQKEEALKYGEIVDINFPDIDPYCSENEIELLSNKYLDEIVCRVSSKDNTVIHIMGEMTFCFSLIRKLQYIGIKCIASTTKRLVSNETNGHKEVEFSFVKFREYGT